MINSTSNLPVEERVNKRGQALTRLFEIHVNKGTYSADLTLDSMFSTTLNRLYVATRVGKIADLTAMATNSKDVTKLEKRLRKTLIDTFSLLVSVRAENAIEYTPLFVLAEKTHKDFVRFLDETKGQLQGDLTPLPATTFFYIGECFGEVCKKTIAFKGSVDQAAELDTALQMFLRSILIALMCLEESKT